MSFYDVNEKAQIENIWVPKVKQNNLLKITCLFKDVIITLTLKEIDSVTEVFPLM